MNSPKRKPLLLRGARQVGKSSSVRHLAENFENFVEINFEKHKAAYTVFENDLNPKEICNKLSTMYRQAIIPGKTLLFLDEIQACPNAISSLRFFFEDYPEQHVIAAGSLMEFALAKVKSFGVGRITNLFMYPFNFPEFMSACGYGKLNDEIKKHLPQTPFFEPFHSKAIEILKTFILIGGMPEAVDKYIETQSIYEAQNILTDLITTLKSDFEKYREKVPLLRLNAVFDGIINQIGQKVVYAKLSRDYNIVQIKECVELLRMAGLVIPVVHTAANGIPLGAESNLKKQKLILFDTGIYLKLSGLDLTDIVTGTNLEMINKGRVAEMFAALELQKSFPANSEPSLYFWHREEKSSTAEVDFIIQKGDMILPIEVKSGTSGKMQSLHLFMKEKHSVRGIRTSLENFATYDKIDVYPLYAVNNIVDEIKKS
ncbi:MAG: AAA family ATPase [Dysgonamonadaceae bacterium]|jgi:predicted AAA+ superfamily ATPase|nr:AAA family ATPase [Dysgonamonadaceae bacterium]